MALHPGTLCRTAVSEVLRPESFEGMETFLDAVRSTWRKTWREAYNGAWQPRLEARLPGTQLRPLRWTLAGPETLREPSKSVD